MINFIRLRLLHPTFFRHLFDIAQRIKSTAEVGLPALETTLAVSFITA